MMNTVALSDVHDFKSLGAMRKALKIDPKSAAVRAARQSQAVWRLFTKWKQLDV